MKVLNLRCSHDHRFEGWFASEDDYQAQIAAGLLVCPVCADAAIDRLPSAPHLNMARARPPADPLAIAAASSSAESGSRDLAPAPPRPAADLSTEPALVMQRLWQQAVQHVMAHTDDVGDRFAEEARRMHYGETDERAIRGQATREEAQSLRDEGIEVMALPLAPARKGPLQ